MAAKGKSINVFLMDGKADGRIKCTLANWTGIAYKIPRTDIERCKDREDLKQSGVYKQYLFGFDYSGITALRDIKRVFNNRLMDFFAQKGI